METGTTRRSVTLLPRLSASASRRPRRRKAWPGRGAMGPTSSGEVCGGLREPCSQLGVLRSWRYRPFRRRTTMRYDRAEVSLDRHVTYIVSPLHRRRLTLTVRLARHRLTTCWAAAITPPYPQWPARHPVRVRVSDSARSRPGSPRRPRSLREVRSFFSTAAGDGRAG